ncbi:MAG: hypothetical protein ACOC1K_02410 [Nanoarchaeota archaeon]
MSKKKKDKKNKKKYWNFRVGTYLYKYDSETQRIFSIIEVYYEDGKPTAYGENNILKDHDSVENLKWTNKKVKLAFKKPILDLDNWPKRFKK